MSMAPGQKPFLLYALAAILVVDACFFLGQGSWFLALGIMELGVIGILCVGPFMIIGIFLVIGAIGVFMAKRWGYMMALVFSILGILIALVDLALIQDIATDHGGSIASMPLILWIIPVMGLVLSILGIVFAFMTKEHYH
jgi:hypothetical protein